MIIKVETIQELIEIVAGLVKENLTFVAGKHGDHWEIELTGGF